MTTPIVALDVDSLDRAMAAVDRLGDAIEWYKIGKQLFTKEGPAVVKGLKDRGKKVFLDMKFHDIPNTVSHAVLSAAAIGADLCNVHASGGPAMLEAAAKAGAQGGITVIAVTVLTSLDEAELAAVGISRPPAEQVRLLAALTKQCGLAGVVCSAKEIRLVQETCGTDFLLVVPGIRPAGCGAGDQKRVMTPGEAAAAGAQFIVVGRPIMAAEDPVAAARAVTAEIRAAEERR